MFILIRGCIKIRPIMFSYALCCFAWAHIRMTRGPQIRCHDDLHPSDVSPPTDKQAASHRACLDHGRARYHDLALIMAVFGLCALRTRNVMGKACRVRCGTNKEVSMKFIANLVSIISGQCKNFFT
jgi:hypothetical protein